jgi:hypothetical protein
MERSGLAAGLEQDELAICERKLSEPCNFHGRDVETVGDLVKMLAEIEPTLSAEEYIVEYRVVVVYLKDVLSEHTTAWIKLFDRLEKVVQDQEAWKEYRLIAAYKEEFGLIQTLRDYKVSNKRNADHARKLVPIFWPTYGRTLLHLRENVQGWARTLLTLANEG